MAKKEKIPAAAKAASAKFWNLKRKESMNGYLFILPWLIGVAIFFAFPIFRSLQLSFSNVVNYSNYQVEWAGLEHYKKAITGDTYYLSSYFNVIKDMLISVPFINIFALLIAVMLNRKFKGRTIFRALFFLPVILGSGAAMWQLTSQGVNAEAMQTAKDVLIPREVAIYLGAEITDFFTYFLNMISTILWKSGVPIVIYLAGLQGVPTTLYEAARVDAATEWEMFWLITLPMITPMMLLNLVYTVIDTFNDSSNYLLRYINKISFGDRSQFEYAAAMSWLFFVWVIFIIAVIFIVMRPFTQKVKEK